MTKLVWITPNSSEMIAYCARVSSNNQNNKNIDGLLNYCINHGHWSIFEMASMCVEIKTSRAISAQILRHRSFSFQEFSTRYQEAQECIIYPARRQDLKNRQNSIDDMPQDDKKWFEEAQSKIQSDSMSLYQEALDRGIAKEQARFLLPVSTKTRLYMSGTIRSWIHYLKVRLDESTQLEHRKIAQDILNIFMSELPAIGNLVFKSEQTPQT